MKTKLIQIFALLVFIIAFGGISQAKMPDPGYLDFAEVMPEPVGGLEALYKNAVYPEIAKKSGVEGKVYVQVFLDEKGNIDDVKVIKSLGAGCDEAAIDAVKKTKFTPGQNKGVAVKTKLALAINFKL